MNDQVSPRLAGLRLRCICCGSSELRWGYAELRCTACAASFARHRHQVVFHPAGVAAGDPLDRLKHPFKRYRRFYGFLVWLLSPLYFDRTRREFLRRHVGGPGKTYLNLGSGNTSLGPHVVNVDQTSHDEVDLVCDIAKLPLEDNSIDGVFNISVLEHVPEPDRVVKEIFRVLRPGGFVYTDVPFVVGYHASPDDYWRWTHQGVRRLHGDFETLQLITNGGPTSALLWVFQEWVAILLSLGSRRLHLAIYVVVLCLTFPLKFLDAFLKHSPLARNVSSCFIFVGRKPSAGPQRGMKDTSVTVSCTR